jgi:hypothetical protein
VTDGHTRPRVLVGRENGDHLAILVLGRMHPKSEDYWDGNWLVTPIEIAVGDFTAEIGASLRAEELRSFCEELEVLCATHKGEASLDSMEGWLHVSVGVDTAGKLIVSGRARDRLGGGNELVFRVKGLDQSDLRLIIEGLNEVEAFYPILGAP